MKVLILGAKGMLGSELARQLAGEQLHALDNDEIDITDHHAVMECVDQVRPEVIFNCAAYNAVDKAESSEQEAKKAWDLNNDAVGYIAEAAQRAGAVLVHFSTGYVFDGSSVTGYAEDAKPDPRSVYAKSKLAGEGQAAKCAKHYIVRLNLLFGKPGTGNNAKKSFPEIVTDLVAQGKTELDFIDDEISDPTYAPDLAAACIQLVREGYPYGIYHLANEGSASWLDYASEIFKIRPADVKLNGISTEQFIAKNAQPGRAERPRNSVLLNTKYPKLRLWQDALKEFLTTIQ